jgi:hypothetical protein
MIIANKYVKWPCTNETKGQVGLTSICSLSQSGAGNERLMTLCRKHYVSSSNKHHQHKHRNSESGISTKRKHKILKEAL